MQRSLVLPLLVSAALLIGFAMLTSARADAGTCTVSGSWPFGTFNAFTFQTSVDTINASVTVSCTGYPVNTTFASKSHPIEISLSTGFSASAGSRFMEGSPSSNHLPYNIVCSDTVYCLPGNGGKTFFNGSTGTQDIQDQTAKSDASGAYTHTYNTQAVIAAGTDPVVASPSTSYSDSLILTVAYP